MSHLADLFIDIQKSCPALAKPLADVMKSHRRLRELHKQELAMIQARYAPVIKDLETKLVQSLIARECIERRIDPRKVVPVMTQYCSINNDNNLVIVIGGVWHTFDEAIDRLLPEAP